MDPHIGVLVPLGPRPGALRGLRPRLVNVGRTTRGKAHRCITKLGPRPAAPTHRRNVVLVWAAAVLVLAAVVVLSAIRTAPGSDFHTRDS